jgi:periplasmic protein CpxP/Spy
MMKRVLIAGGLIAALAGGTAVTLAQGPGPGAPGLERQGRGPRGPRLDVGLRGVQLTDAQREQVRAIVASHRAEFESVRTSLREAHRAFAEGTRGTTVDEATIRSQSTAIANAMAEDAILRAKVRAEVHALLTAEQQQQLKEREATMQKRMQERQQRRQQRQPQVQQPRQRPPQ